MKYLEKPGQDWALTKSTQRVVGRCASSSAGLKHSYPVPAAAHMAPSSSEQVVDGVLGSILCSPFPRVSPLLLPLQKIAKCRTSSPWNCFRVGCAQEVTKATNFQLGVTGWERSHDGVVPSIGKSQELSGCKVSLQNECLLNVQGNRLSAVGSLPGEQGQQWAGVCAAAAEAHLALSGRASHTHLSRSAACQHWTAPTCHRWHRSPPSC